MSRLKLLLMTGALLGAISAGAPVLANDGTRDGAATSQEARPPSGEATEQPQARNPQEPQVTPPMTPGCPYRGAKLELIV